MRYSSDTMTQWRSAAIDRYPSNFSPRSNLSVPSESTSTISVGDPTAPRGRAADAAFNALFRQVQRPAARRALVESNDDRGLPYAPRMQGYRGTPPTLPLLSLVSGRLVAIDPMTGALRWERPMERAVDRVVVAGANAFVVTRAQDDGRVLVIDLASGAELGQVELGFRVMAGLATPDRVYFSGAGGLVCLTHEGGIVFRLARDVTARSAWSGDSFDLVGLDAQNREAWRIRDTTRGFAGGSFLALGPLVAQVDIEG